MKVHGYISYSTVISYVAASCAKCAFRVQRFTAEQTILNADHFT
jgi:hypothetical protein